jgi:hypothetical protein
MREAELLSRDNRIHGAMLSPRVLAMIQAGNPDELRYFPRCRTTVGEEVTMSRTSKATSPKDRFDHLLKVIASERFLKKQGLGNEVPFFICPYPADEAVAMEAMRASLVKQLENRGVRVIEINLYDLSIAGALTRGVFRLWMTATESTVN